MRAFAALLVVACSGSPADPSVADPSVSPATSESSGSEGASGACVEPTWEALLAAANLEGELQGELMVYSAQLDGEGERETVLGARMGVQGEPDNPMTPLTITDHLVVFECREGALSLTTDWTFDATPDNGTFDCETGVRRVDMQRVGAREMFVVTTHQCQGSVDPRWDEERMLFLAYSGEGFDEVFSCAFLEDHATGPCRSGASIRRRVQISDDPTPTIQVSMERSFDPGACEDEEAGAGETDLAQEATYSWNGSTFVSSGEEVCR